MGAIASGGIRILSNDVVAAFGVPDQAIALIAANQEEELDRQERMYRDDRPALAVRGRTIILIDDGLATGATMRAAVTALRVQRPEQLTVAVPVAPEETCAALRQEADEVVCLLSPQPFFAVGNWYHDFSQISDEEVRQLLQLANSSLQVPPRR